jgi:hypothetical protein
MLPPTRRVLSNQFPDRAPVAAFTARQELKAYLRRRLDAFINPLVCTFWGGQGTPSIMTMSAALAE